MTYKITRADLASINDVELAFSTDRFLPEWKDIHEAFKKPNIYSQIAEALCLGFKMPQGEVTFLDGFPDEGAAKDLDRCVRAHVQSFGPSHEHKIAGVGFMISQVCKIEPTKGNPKDSQKEEQHGKN